MMPSPFLSFICYDLKSRMVVNLIRDSLNCFKYLLKTVFSQSSTIVSNQFLEIVLTPQEIET